MDHGEIERGVYDAELQRHNGALLRAYEIAPDDRVLDVGCGAGETTRDAARLASEGSALGVDVSEEMIQRARSRAAAEGIRNVTFEQGDAQDFRFPPSRFDQVISRFGTMFFGDPIAAFSNIGSALRPPGRLLMMVWQAPERNGWSRSVHGAIRSVIGSSGPDIPELDAFSLAEPATVRKILTAAGFTDVTFTDVDEPVFYGRDVDAALEWVSGFACTRRALALVDPTRRQFALERLREMLAEHEGEDGVWFDSRAWIVGARRR
ncbi:MAG TPA: methyltransferase domain-containing protein [Actinomycetota bacterium]|nr:methyltransferase domain-containing protein [Actinomycetota bacterium]